MVVRPGFFSSNLIGKQAGGSPITPANQTAGYVFSTGTTTQLGTITVTKKTGGSFPSNTIPTYDTPSSTMTFNGTNQAMAYAPNAEVQVAPVPFSFQVDFNTTKLTGNQYIVNLGQGNGVGWPCWQVSIGNPGQLYMVQATQDGGVGMSTYNIAIIAANKWYRLGVMYYRVGTTNYNRVYLNGEVKVQTTLGTSTTNAGGQGGLPRTTQTSDSSQAGLTFGNDGANASGYNFQGQMRNIFFGKTAFWTI